MENLPLSGKSEPGTSNFSQEASPRSAPDRMRQSSAYPATDPARWIALGLVCLALCLLALHLVHPSSDPSPRFGFHSSNTSGDFYTDEGWEANAARLAAQTGHWYRKGDFNLAIDAPMWSALLFLPFRYAGATILVARTVAIGFFLATAGLLFLFVRRNDDSLTAALSLALVSANVLAYTYGRLAMTETAFVFFIMLSLFCMTYAARCASAGASLLCGLVLAMGVLTKMTALFALAPLLLTLWFWSRGVGGFKKKALAATLGVILPTILQRLAASYFFRVDHRFYVEVNIRERAIHSPIAWFEYVLRDVFKLHQLGLFLYAAFLLGALLVFLFERRRNFDKLEWICIAWIVCNLLALSVVRYFPSRYCFSFLIPIAILASKFARSVTVRSAWVGYGLYGMLALAILLDTASILHRVAHPSYTYSNFAAQVLRIAKQSSATPIVMGDSANMISLYAPVDSVNDRFATAPIKERIEEFSPSVYITIAPVTPGRLADFQQSGKSLSLSAESDLLGDYAEGHRAYVYTVSTASSHISTTFDTSGWKNRN